jgi:arylsulfatase A-like enzyme
MAAGRMVRSERFKYCFYDMGERRESLFDMEKDPGETVNLARDSSFASILERHRQYYLEWRKKYKDLDFPAPPGT